MTGGFGWLCGCGASSLVSAGDSPLLQQAPMGWCEEMGSSIRPLHGDLMAICELTRRITRRTPRAPQVRPTEFDCARVHHVQQARGSRHVMRWVKVLI